MQILLNPIGTIKTPFFKLENMPTQPYGAKDTLAKVIVNEDYQEGLKDLDGFSHIYLIYYFHKIKEHKLSVVPFNDKMNMQRGVFSTRTPVRPNKIGLSKVRIESVEGNVITVRGIDILDGTPLLDIKPYIENFDVVYGDVSSGWMTSSKEDIEQKKSDNRFVDQ